MSFNCFIDSLRLIGCSLVVNCAYVYEQIAKAIYFNIFFHNRHIYKTTTSKASFGNNHSLGVDFTSIDHE